MEFNFKANQGQALMMMVMVMFVGLTMVLIIFMNSLSNLQLSTTEEQSERAFNISEAGIEKLLAQDDPVPNLPNTTDDIESEVNTTGETDYKYTINKNDTGEIQLKDADTDGVDIYWTNADDENENPPSDACGAAGMIIEKWSMGEVIYVCTGDIPEHATPCDSDESGLTTNTSRTLVSACTEIKCEYTCSSGYTFDGTNCVLTVYACQGVQPSGTTLCPDDNTGLSGPTNYTEVSSSSNCTSSTKCEYYPTTYSCGGILPTGATLCTGDDSGLSSSANYVKVSNASGCNDTAKCQYYFACTGSNSYDNAIFCTDDDKDLVAPVAYSLVSACTSTKCEYTCNTGYTYSAGSCQQSCTDDTYEQNDSLAAATNIQQSSLSAKACTDDTDWYKKVVTLPSGSKATLKFTLTNSTGNLRITLKNNYGTYITSSSTIGKTTTSVSTTLNSSGTYYVEILADERYSTSDPPYPYTLATSVTSVLGAQTGAVLGVGTYDGVTTQEAGSAYKVTRYVYQPYYCLTPLDGDQGGDTGVWDYAAASSDSESVFKSMATIPVTPDDIMLRVRPIYNKATIQAVSNNTNYPLPIQLHNIESSAQVDVSGEARALQVVRTVPQLPSIFDYVLFSGEKAIVKE